MTSFYKIVASADSATLHIFDVIGLNGLQADAFRAELAKVTARRVKVEINSPGGDVFTGVTIFNTLRQCGKAIDVKVMGIAASAASYIAMAGDTIEMPANTFMMVHNPSVGRGGNARELRRSADVLDKIGETMIATYSAKSGRSKAEVGVLLDKDTWMSADEALALGFATKVSAAVEVKAAFATAHAALPAHVVAALQAPKSSSTSAQRAPTTSDIWANRNFNKGSSK
jgi:ATP-dependent Clp endopeptidase proteolytic subunit ClpP